jgi:hypothetical protein
MEDVAAQRRPAAGGVEADGHNAAKARGYQQRREQRGVSQQDPDVWGLVRI